MEATSCEICLDISFGFDDDKYSDKTLLLEIINDDDDNRNVKRRRSDTLITANTEPRVKTVRINSLILAARSTFFRKLFSNGMLESEQKNVTLRIETLAEEASLMDLLKYVYTKNLPTALNALLDLCVTADKFEVASCLRDCVQSLEKLPMTCKSACIYLDLTQSLSIIEPSIDKAKKFLSKKFKDFHKCEEEILVLPLTCIRVILSSDDLQVTSENAVYDFVLTRVRKHYPDSEERRGILKTHLLHLVRFPFMSTTKLVEEVQICNDIDPEVASKIVMNVLRFKADQTPHQIAEKEGNAASQQFVERAYKHRPVKVVEFALPHQQCIVYLDIRKEDLKSSFRDGEVRSEIFHFGGLALTLFIKFSVNTYNSLVQFWPGLKVVESAACTFNYEITARQKSSKEFGGSLMKGHSIFKSGSTEIILCSRGKNYNIDFTDDYLINGVLHLRAVLTVTK